jgi:hypothetical protein
VDAPAAIEHGGHAEHGAAADGDAFADGRGAHCPHCPIGGEGGAGGAHDNEHASCLTLEDLTSGLPSHAKEAPQALVPLDGPPELILRPPLAAAPALPASCAPRIPRVPLNVRHCVYLI